MANKFIVSLSPHVHSGDSVQKNMYGVIIALIPGNAFGPGGEGYIRLSYAAADSVIDTAIERLQNFMNNLG